MIPTLRRLSRRTDSKFKTTLGCISSLEQPGIHSKTQNQRNKINKQTYTSPQQTCLAKHYVKKQMLILISCRTSGKLFPICHSAFSKAVSHVVDPDDF